MRYPESVSCPFSTLEVAFSLIYESKVFIDEASPWVPELNPFKTSLVTNPSVLVTLKIPVFPFQFCTIPLVLLIEPVTISFW